MQEQASTILLVCDMQNPRAKFFNRCNIKHHLVDIVPFSASHFMGEVFPFQNREPGLLILMYITTNRTKCLKESYENFPVMPIILNNSGVQRVTRKQVSMRPLMNPGF